MKKIKRITQIVFQESGVSSAYWIIASLLPAADQWFRERTGASVTSLLPAWVPEPSWTWGLAVLGAWVIVSLSSRIIVYETPALGIELVRDRRDNSVWLEVRNLSGRTLKNCAVDFEKIVNRSGERVFPYSFGMARPGERFNPFPLRGKQPKQGMFAQLVNGKITLFGTTIDRQFTNITLALEEYTVTVGAYSEEDGAQCRMVFTLARRDGELVVEQATAAA